jgi:hypothetical protein
MRWNLRLFLVVFLAEENCSLVQKNRGLAVLLASQKHERPKSRTLVQKSRLDGVRLRYALVCAAQLTGNMSQATRLNRVRRGSRV